MSTALIALAEGFQVACMAFVSGIQPATRRGLRQDQVGKASRPYILIALVASVVLLATIFSLLVTRQPI